MDRQSQQLVVASLVAFVTSGVITLAGLSSATEMMSTGGDAMQYPSHDSSTPPAGTSTSTYTPPAGESMQWSQPASYTPPAGGGTQWDGKTFFQKDGADFPMHGENDQKDGAGFHKGGDTWNSGAEWTKTWNPNVQKGVSEHGVNIPLKGEKYDWKHTDGTEGSFDLPKYGKGEGGGYFPGKFEFGGEHEKGREARAKLQRKLRESETIDEDEDISEEELAELDAVTGKATVVSTKEILAMLQDAAADVQDLKSDLKDATSAVNDLKKDDKKLDQAVVKVEKKYGDVEEAPAKVQEQIAERTVVLTEKKEDLQEQLGAVDENIDEVETTIVELKETIQENKEDIKQASSLLETCDALLWQLANVDKKYNTLETKVEHIEIGHSA